MQEIIFKYKADKTKLSTDDYSIIEDMTIGLTLNLAIALNLNYSFNTSELAAKLKKDIEKAMDDNKNNDVIEIVLNFATSLELSIIKIASILVHADSSPIRQLLQPYKRYLINNEHINNDSRLANFTKILINGKSIYSEDISVPMRAVIDIDLVNF